MTDAPVGIDKPSPPVDPSVLTTGTSTSQEVIQQQTSVQDYVILRYAVIGLILVALVAIIGSLALIGTSSTEVQAGVTAIIALGGVAVGGLATMLVRPPLYPSPPSVRMGSATDRRQQ
jgi:hypothetical protein